MKKILIIIFLTAGLIVGVLILVKRDAFRGQRVEIKINNKELVDVSESKLIQENIESANTEENMINKKPEETAKNNEVKKSEEIVDDENDLKEVSIMNNLVSWGYEKTDSRKIDTIIIHSSYNALGGDEYDLDKLIKEYKEYGVSPHYLIDRKGKIYRLVADKNIAYHAGESQVPDGRGNVNNFSIGIELMNTKDDKFTSEQYASLKKLIADLKSDYKIKYVLGHNQIAPGRKTDPWNFDWGRL